MFKKPYRILLLAFVLTAAAPVAMAHEPGEPGEERGFFDQVYDGIFGSDHEHPHGHTPEEAQEHGEAAKDRAEEHREDAQERGADRHKAAEHKVEAKAKAAEHEAKAKAKAKAKAAGNKPKAHNPQGQGKAGNKGRSSDR